MGPLWIGCGEEAHPPIRFGDTGCMIDSDFGREHDQGQAKLRDFLDIKRVAAQHHELIPTAELAYAVSKRLMDVIISLTLLVGLMPFLLIATTMTAFTTKSWPLVAERRPGRRGNRGSRGRGYRGETFRGYRLKLPLDPDHRDGRLRGFSRLIGRTGLDQAPLLLSVLVGDMSMVGPSPAETGEDRFCPTWRELRRSVRPGLTGLWKIRDVPQGNLHDLMASDIEYVRRAGLALEMKILLKTILRGGKRG